MVQLSELDQWTLEILKAMDEMGGLATCKELAGKLRCSPKRLAGKLRWVIKLGLIRRIDKGRFEITDLGRSVLR